jgi:hypothetical protein
MAVASNLLFQIMPKPTFPYSQSLHASITITSLVPESNPGIDVHHLHSTNPQYIYQIPRF